MLNFELDAINVEQWVLKMSLWMLVLFVLSMSCAPSFKSTKLKKNNG